MLEEETVKYMRRYEKGRKWGMRHEPINR
jgi:hypothetical protein